MSVNTRIEAIRNRYKATEYAEESLRSFEKTRLEIVDKCRFEDFYVTEHFPPIDEVIETQSISRFEEFLKG
ncbi:hypothetical protein MTR_1g053480 [Medicago truncatula]|uniref:Uncharacterized protein n=1 Tax=Medicago truncatula TaxID=3880 RepID=A0A072VI05_MEDTR|nr:hypothetical protein MTR_1g053480 [Medicago truncatula]